MPSNPLFAVGFERPRPGPPCRFWRVWYRDADAAEVQCRHFFSTSTQPSGRFSAGPQFWDASQLPIPSELILSPPCRRNEHPRSATPPTMEANAVVVPVTLPPENFPRDGHNAQALGRGLNALVKQVCPSQTRVSCFFPLPRAVVQYPRLPCAASSLQRLRPIHPTSPNHFPNLPSLPPIAWRKSLRTNLQDGTRYSSSANSCDTVARLHGRRRRNRLRAPQEPCLCRLRRNPHCRPRHDRPEQPEQAVSVPTRTHQEVQGVGRDTRTEAEEPRS